MIIYDRNMDGQPENGNIAKEGRLMDSMIFCGMIDMLKEDIARQQEKIKSCDEKMKKMAECNLEEPMKDKYIEELTKERDGYSSNMSASRRTLNLIRDKIKNGRGISNIIDMNGSEILPLLERILKDTVE